LLPPLLTMLASTPDELVYPTATALVEYKVRRRRTNILVLFDPVL
jgi:hypothetical protein